LKKDFAKIKINMEDYTSNNYGLFNQIEGRINKVLAENE
jgi:hypothetical protein